LDKPAYAKLGVAGLKERAEKALSLLEECTVCPHECRVNRFEGEAGVCRSGRRAAVSSYGPHFGEEAPLVGKGGSGTIFFSRCNLRCIFCQNFDISHEGGGREVTASELAQIMLRLQERGCHNINLVSPSHFVPQILEALVLAFERGLRLPLVYNTGGYDAPGTIELLDGVVDIYMPDLKYGDDETGRELSGAPRYFTVACAAVKMMHGQVGDLVVDDDGIAVRGLLVRHLVLPGGLAGTEKVVKFLAEEISPHTFVNIMDQYYPAYRAFAHPVLKRRITAQEYSKAVKAAVEAGLKRIYTG